MRINRMVAIGTLVFCGAAEATLFYPNFVAYYTYPENRPTTITNMVPCSNRGYIMVGKTALVWVITKLDPFGKKQWRYAPDGYSRIPPSAAVVMTQKGKCVVAAAMRLGPSEKDYTDVVRIAQMDQVTGAIEWERTHTLGSYNQVAGILETSDGGFLIGGTLRESNFPYTDIVVVKTDSLGALLRTEIYGVPNCNESMVKMHQTISGEIVALGIKNEKSWLLRMNAGADTLWTRMYFYGAKNSFTDVQTSPDGNYVCVGTTSDVAGAVDVWAQKINDKGDYLWSKHYNNGGGEDVTVSSCACLPGGGFVLSAGIQQQNVLLKINEQGDSVWCLRYGCTGTHTPSRVLISPQGRFVTGGSYSPWADSSIGYFLVFESESKSIPPQGFGNWSVVGSAICDFGLCNIAAITIDSADHPWVNISGANPPNAFIEYHTGGGWKQFTGIPVQRIRKMTVSSKGTLWFAADRGVYRYAGDTVSNTPVETQAFGVASVDDTLVYIGGERGLYTLKNNILTLVPEATAGLPGNYVTAVAVDRQSRAWFLTSTGVTVKDGPSYTHYANNTSPLPGRPRDLKTDAAGAVWIATMNGLARYSGGVWKTFDSTNTVLPASSITAFTVTPTGVPIIACDQGFSIYGTDTLYNYHNSPLPSDIINCMDIDRTGAIWIGTSKGLVCIKPHSNSIHNPMAINQGRRPPVIARPKIVLAGFNRNRSADGSGFLPLFDLRGRSIMMSGSASSAAATASNLFIVKYEATVRKK